MLPILIIKDLEKAGVYEKKKKKKNMIDTDGNLYLTADSLVETNNIVYINWFKQYYFEES